MAVRIYSNPLSVKTQNVLGGVKGRMDKSIQRISSGIRLNSASDDASGFAVSQKLKAQITGLAMASRNTQDGVSYLQTAEGGLDIMGQMVNRMRELSVQGSNGVYTTTDRAELQKEVDQLKSEVNRISNSTEFNTKKLLNGESTALYSSSSSDVKAVVKGDVQEGSYEIRVSSAGGKNAVYESGVFKTNDDEYNASVRYSGAATSQVIGIETDKDLIGGMKYDASAGSAYEISFGAGTATVTAAAKVNSAFFDVNSTFKMMTGAITMATATNQTGYIEARVTKFDNAALNAIENAVAPAAGTSPDKGKITSASTLTTGFATGNFEIQWRFHNVESGEATGWHKATTVTVGTGGVSISINATGGDDVNGLTVGVGFSINVTNSSDIKLNVGDTFVLDAQAEIPAGTKQGYTMAISGGAQGHSIQSSLQVAYSNIRPNNNDGKTDYSQSQIYFGSLDKSTGEFNFGGVKVNVRESSLSGTAGKLTDLTNGAIKFEVRSGGNAATSGTKLNQLSNFVTSDGRRVFDGHNTQELTMYTNSGTSHKITLVGDDNLNDVDNKISEAMIKLGLGASIDNIDSKKWGNSSSATVSRINESLVTFVNPGSVKSGEVQSTFVMKTARVGGSSNIYFVGDEAVINGLGLKERQKGEDASMIVSAKNLSTGQSARTEQVKDGVYRGIDNMDIHIAGGGGKFASFISGADTLHNIGLVDRGGVQSYNISTKNNATKLQIGSSEGQSFDVSVPQINTSSLGIDDAFVFSQDKAQKAITKFDDALRHISSIRATIGAQINRIGFTSTNLDTMRENMVASNSRIEDADVAQETSEFQRNQVLNQAATSMLAQANAQTQSALSLLG